VRYPVDEQRPVRQAGQRVVVRLVPQLGLPCRDGAREHPVVVHRGVLPRKDQDHHNGAQGDGYPVDRSSGEVLAQDHHCRNDQTDVWQDTGGDDRSDRLTRLPLVIVDDAAEPDQLMAK